MRIGRGNRSTRRKPVPVQLRPPRIPHGLIWDRIRAPTVVSRRLTAGAKIQILKAPGNKHFHGNYKCQQKILLAGPRNDGISVIYNQHPKGAALHTHNRIITYCHVFSDFRRVCNGNRICWTLSTRDYK
jgi:hypothetical protein